MTTTVLAKQKSMTVIATTRSARKAQTLERIGVDHVILDEGEIAEQV